MGPPPPPPPPIDAETFIPLTPQEVAAGLDLCLTTHLCIIHFLPMIGPDMEVITTEMQALVARIRKGPP